MLKWPVDERGLRNLPLSGEGTYMPEENIQMDRKESENAMQEETVRELYLPGDMLEGGDLRPGTGTYYRNGKIFSSQLGVKSVRSNYVNISPLSGRYMPHSGDAVIGIVCDLGPSNWLIDIGAPYYAPMHVNEAPWKVEFGDTGRFDEMKKVQVTMNGPQLRKLNQGILVEIPPSKVPRVIGRSGSMIKMIVNYTKCRLFVGQNGRIWIDGDIANIGLAKKVIRKIDEEAQVIGLTERIKEYLEKETGITIEGK
jgi:exosome complex component RRP4